MKTYPSVELCRLSVLLQVTEECFTETTKVTFLEIIQISRYQEMQFAERIQCLGFSEFREIKNILVLVCMRPTCFRSTYSKARDIHIRSYFPRKKVTLQQVAHCN